MVGIFGGTNNNGNSPNTNTHEISLNQGLFPSVNYPKWQWAVWSPSRASPIVPRLPRSQTPFLQVVYVNRE